MAAADLSIVADIATIIGLPIALAGLFYAGWQLHLSAQIAKAQFMLELEKMSQSHDEVHWELRPGGRWAGTGAGPKKRLEWATVEDYMGFFEQCEALLARNCIDQEVFSRLFTYRIRNIVANEIIVEAKLKHERESWKLFLDLMKRLDIPLP